ncbi:alpha/beta hydrolase [Paenibacillus woosongensis]|uniref:Alpha/beta fold hydrolase n=1 Tax=Paenibacillus woosongensis TaxID=307580 RepID=A0A7X3CL43_9BACL|nr:alpha/beta hydrolase [Paenibacillus woosongensis]MUG43948.1 alpha/beta fold hydrolase [Paenibacillus woosongensis]
MLEQTFTFTNDAQNEVFVYHWSPVEMAGVPQEVVQNELQGVLQSRPQGELQGVLQIAHGMAETAKRYERLAEMLTARGWIVFASDHRGHGKTAGTEAELGCIEKDGFGGMVRDMSALSGIIRDRYPDLPLFLLGHSMGSFLTQKMMYTAPEPYSGFILSGTNGPRGMISFGEKLARLQCLVQGERHPSLMLNALVFGSYNKRFLPPRTPFDWLSRDEAEVDKYVNDPHCGFLCSAGFFQGFFSLLQDIHRPQRMRAIPKDKPIYIFGGDEDPVGLRGDGVKKLASLYNLLLIRDVELKLYPGGRHEMLNEINREEVMRDLAGWLERHK